MELQEYLFAEIKNKLDYLDKEFEYSLEANFNSNKETTKADYSNMLGCLFSDLRQYMQNVSELKDMLVLLEREVKTAQENSVSFSDEDILEQENIAQRIVENSSKIYSKMSDEQIKEMFRQQDRLRRLSSEFEEEKAR